MITVANDHSTHTYDVPAYVAESCPDCNPTLPDTPLTHVLLRDGEWVNSYPSVRDAAREARSLRQQGLAGSLRILTMGAYLRMRQR